MTFILPLCVYMIIEKRSQKVQFQYGQNKQETDIRLLFSFFYIFGQTKKVKTLLTILGPTTFQIEICQAICSVFNPIRRGVVLFAQPSRVN